VAGSTRAALAPIFNKRIGPQLGAGVVIAEAAALAAHDEWVAAGRPGAQSHEDVMAGTTRQGVRFFLEAAPCTGSPARA
jgi:hypothetical protein